jgi:hypothetical protein
MKRFNVNLVANKATFCHKFLSAFLLVLISFTFASISSAADKGLILNKPALVPITTVADVELIVNGSFEEPKVTSPGGWTTYFGQNYTSGIATCPLNTTTCNDGTLIPGWSVMWSHPMAPDPDWIPEPGRIELQSDVAAGRIIGSCTACRGEQKAELDSHHRLGDTTDNNATIYQILKTCPGLAYTFKYSWKGREDVVGMSDLDVLIDDVLLTQHVQFDESWRNVTHIFTANQTGISAVAFHSCGDGNTLGVFLDSISVIGPDGSVPELCDEPYDLCDFGDKPISLTLLYDGNDDTNHHQVTDEVIVDPEVVTAYPDPAHIVIYGNNKNEDALYAGTYSIGERIIITGPRNRIPSRLKFEIRDPANGDAIVQTVQFHTSCSQPLFIGDEFGGITVLSAIQ